MLSFFFANKANASDFYVVTLPSSSDSKNKAQLHLYCHISPYTKYKL